MSDIQAAPSPLAGPAAQGTAQWLWRMAPPLLLAVLALLLLVLIGAPLRVLWLHIPLSYNEGWNAFHTARLMDGGPLYPPISPSVFNNYLPLSFYVVGLIGRVLGDDIVAGRILALISLFIVAFDVGLICRSLGCDRFVALASGLAFLAFVAFNFPDYIATDDPQWFGHALQITGLAVLLRRSPFSFKTMLVVALLLLLGGLAKQTLVALPLAITLWFLFEDRRLALRWLAIVAALAVSATAGLAAIGGHGLVEQVVLAGRNYSSDMFARVLELYGSCLLAYPILAAIGLIAFRHNRNVRLIAFWLVIGTILGLTMMTAVGVLYNVLFDAVAAAAIGIGLMARFISERTVQRSGNLHAAMTETLLVCALPLLFSPPVGLGNIGLLDAEIEAASTWQASIDLLANARGPVACETLALCYWAHRPSAFEFFNFGQYVVKHPSFAGPITDQIAGGKLAVIQMEGPDGTFRLSPELNALIQARYAPVQSAPTALLTPRAKAASPSAQ